MKAFVDPNTCIGCTQCAGLCPEVYSMEGTLAVAIPGEIPAELATQAAQAADNCPVDAIHLDSASELVMGYAGRFAVKMPYGADYDKMLAFLSIVMDTLETNETGVIDLTTEGKASVLKQ